jgi:AcrR family transcriptional regulator
METAMTTSNIAAKEVRSRRGAPAKGEPTARERILAIALDAFYREGILATGVDTIAERAGVSKTSLYRNFSSKDELIEAVLKEQNRLFFAWWDEMMGRHADDPRAQLRGLLNAFGKLSSSPRFRGCPFINAATEFRGLDHVGKTLAAQNKIEVVRRLADMCRVLGAPDPVRAARQLLLLIDGVLTDGQFGAELHFREGLADAAFACIGLDA